MNRKTMTYQCHILGTSSDLVKGHT